MIGPGKQLGTQVICPSDERLALELAYHVPSQLLRELLETLLNHRLTMGSLGNI